MAVRGREIKVVCFDVDGTLVHHRLGKTVWQVLNERFLGDDVRNGERFELFQSGQLTYADWVALDIGDWIGKGVLRADIEAAIRQELVAAAGAHETMTILRERGYRLAVISGTINLTLDLLLGGISFDRVYSNRIFFHQDGRISGWEATAYDVDGKARAMGEVAAEFGVHLAECAFVGDHWNDLAALASAGLAVAFCPKDDSVREAADVVVEHGPLTLLLDHFPGAP